MATRLSVFVPHTVGVAALAELDRVAWSELAHAYGVGKVGDALHEDVEASLRELGQPGRLLDGVEALASNVFHQGTIYEATPPALGFMLALAAGSEIGRAGTRVLLALIADIAIASAWETEDAGFAGAFGEEVGERTRAVLRTSRSRLQEIGAKVPALAELAHAIEQFAVAERMSRARVEELLALVEELPELEDEAAALAANPQWFVHAKFGRCCLVRREEGEKLRLRFDDGSERVILARFVQAADS